MINFEFQFKINANLKFKLRFSVYGFSACGGGGVNLEVASTPETPTTSVS